MLRWIGKLIDRLLVIAGAILLAQFPQFYSQYLQQLTGHTAELGYQVALMKDASVLSNTNLTEWLHKFLSNSDTDIAKQGQLMQGMIERLDSLTTAQNSLTHASLFTKPFLFIRYSDLDIIRSTCRNFTWGFNFTIETLAYALIGMLLGFLFFQLLRAPFRALGSKFKKNP